MTKNSFVAEVTLKLYLYWEFKKISQFWYDSCLYKNIDLEWLTWLTVSFYNLFW